MLSILWTLWIWRLVSVTSGEVSVGGGRVSFSLFVYKGATPVSAWDFWSRSREWKVELVACGFRLEWHVDWLLAAVLPARLSSPTLPLWTLNLRCTVSGWLLPFMGLIGVLPPVSGHSFALCKTGLSCTNLTDVAQERCWPLPFYSKSISRHYYCIFHSVSYMGRSVRRIKVFRKSWKFQRILLRQ